MEKWKPHYRLSDVQAVVADPGSRPFTRTALEGGRELGLTEAEMRRVVCALARSDFYKSMTAKRDPSAWQDVYHGESPDGTAVYVKVTAYADGRPPVIQFKAK
ncbi:MAG: type II toxin-antitoxin system MqsR family toxin [Deferrisomatales bacterium]